MPVTLHYHRGGYSSFSALEEIKGMSQVQLENGLKEPQFARSQQIFTQIRDSQILTQLKTSMLYWLSLLKKAKNEQGSARKACVNAITLGNPFLELN